MKTDRRLHYFLAGYLVGGLGGTAIGLALLLGGLS